MYLSLFISACLFCCEIVSQVVINLAKTSSFIAQFAISVKKMLILRRYYQIVIRVLSDIDSYAVFCHSRSLVLRYSFFMTAFLVKMINEPYHFSKIKSVEQEDNTRSNIQDRSSDYHHVLRQALRLSS